MSSRLLCLSAFTAAFIAAVSLAVAVGTAGVGDPHGVWMIEREVAVEIFDCNGLLCGRIVYLKVRAMRQVS